MKKLIFIYIGLIACLHTVKASNVQGNMLPLALQSFSAACLGEKVNLTWKAFAGTAHVFFTVEKSKDGKTFTKLAEISNTENTAIGYKDYMEADYKPYKGKTYYRLKQTDENGECKYSATITVTTTQQKKLAMYHMPANATVDNSIKSGYDSQEVVLVLRDLQGSEFVSKVLLMPEKNVVFLLDDKESLPKGNYTVTSSSYDKIDNYQLTVR